MPSIYPKWALSLYQQHTEDPEVGEEEEREPLDRKHKHLDSTLQPCSCSKNKEWSRLYRLFTCTVITANILLFLTSMAMISVNCKSKKHCTEKDVSGYSPIFDRVEIKKTPGHYNFSFWPDNPPSIYQQRPSPEVDAAWERLSTTESIALSADEVRKIGFDPATVWPIPPDPKYDTGEIQYFGLIDVFHQVHCLNSMRKTTFPAYYGDRREKFKSWPLPYEDHLLHCQYILLRSILCSADVEVTIFQKYKGWPGLNANFGTNRMCRNFEDILEWKEANAVNPDGPWTEYPVQGIVELDPEGRFSPWGTHLDNKGQVIG